MSRIGPIVAQATRAAILLPVVGAASFPFQTAAAQSDQGTEVVVDPEASASPTLEPEDDPSDGTAQSVSRSVTPMVALVQFKNTQLGWGLMLMGGLIHRFDSDPTVKPSTGMLG